MSEDEYPEAEPRPIPHNKAAEQAVIGDALLRACPPQRLNPAHFWNPTYRRVAEAIIATAEAGETIDPITVAERCDGITPEQLIDAESKWSTAAWESHLVVLERYHRARQAIGIANRLLDLGYRHPVDIEHGAAALVAELRALATEVEDEVGARRGPRAA